MTGTFIVIFAVIIAIWAGWVAWQVAKGYDVEDTLEHNPRWPFPPDQKP